MKEELEKLKLRFEEIKPIVKVGFNTSKELQEYKKLNIEIFNEFYAISEKIDKLKYELLSPKEKKDYDEYRRLSKLKAEGKPLI